MRLDDAISDLRLGPYMQDWAIISSDEGRLDEFADYLVTHWAAADEEARGELFELVLASADDGSNDRTAARTVARVVATCPDRGPLVSLIVEHWEEYWRTAGRPLLLAAITKARGT